MDGSNRRARALLRAVGTALTLAGPVMLLRGSAGRNEIRAELTAQKITFPVRRLPVELAAWAGRPVETGPAAQAYARYIHGNVERATGGRTYAEITAQLHAAGGDDTKLAELRHTAFMGQSLRASLMSAYQAWQLTSLVMGLGTALTCVGVTLVATADALGPAAPRRP